MSDEGQRKGGGLEDLDWDSALDEWEKNTFVPEMARDAETNRVVEPIGDAEKKPTVAPPPAETSSSLPRTSPPTAEPRPHLRSSPPVADDPPSPHSFPPSSRLSQRPSLRGGLDQLFSRGRESAVPPLPPLPPLPPPAERSTPSPFPQAAPQTVSELPSLLDANDEAHKVDTKLILTGNESSSPIVVKEFDSEPNFDIDETVDRLLSEAPTTTSLDVAASAHDDAPDVETSAHEDAPDVETSAHEDAPDVYASDLAGTGSYLVPEKAEPSASPSLRPIVPSDEDDMPTLARPSSIPAGLRPASIAPLSEVRRPAPSQATTFEDERPAARWLDEARTQALSGSIAWLEEEAQAQEDPAARGRALLALSELSAVVGDMSRADAFASEAREAAPHLSLAWRQARQLMARDPEMLADALTAEAAQSSTSSARAHAVLLAADVLRLHDRPDGAAEHWASACKLDPTDIRAPIARAAVALASDDHSSTALHVEGNSELTSLDSALTTLLRLRGVERTGASGEALPVNDGLRHLRAALTAGDIVRASQAAAEIAAVPELANGARWLSASLGAVHIAARRGAARSLKALATEGDPLARRQLAARGMELADPDLVSVALSGGTSFELAERAVLEALAHPDQAASASVLEALAGDPNASALVDALTALDPPSADERAVALRSRMVAGSSRELSTLGRLLAANASASAIDTALAAIADPKPATAAGVALETAVREKRFAELSEILLKLPGEEHGNAAHQRNVAAGLIAERAGRPDLAAAAWREAQESAPAASDVLPRVVASLDTESPGTDLGALLLRLTETMPDGAPSAILRLEALARSELGDDAQAEVLEHVQRALPSLGIASFLAEHAARRRNDVDEVVRLIQERRASVTDPLEAALDAVREALLIADHDADAAGARLEEAQRSRPGDVALRELYQRIAPEAPDNNAESWEKRAEAASGPKAAQLWLEAAVEHDRSSDSAALLRTARKAVEHGDAGLGPQLTLRAELETGDASALAERLSAEAEATDDEGLRNEALERLADLEAFGRNEPAAALRARRAILERTPADKASLRAVEHALIGGGLDDALGDVFEQIALALDGTSGGEVTGHAQHASRIFLRGASGEIPPTAYRAHDMARLAATQPEVSLWALRSLHAHARARKDDETFFDLSVALVERTPRPAERATLLLRAGEAAIRLERFPAARALVEQAISEDPGDVVGWGLLAELRERDGESAGAGEACEALARASSVPEHQLLAWHDAAKIWLDVVEDSDRGVTALEAAAAIDVTYADIFPRLSALYVEKKRESDLARLLELRLQSVSDEDERVTLEVDLARALADLGELKKARAHLDRALLKRPDHTTALSALAEVNMLAGDWAGTEHASVRLARLLTDPAEQRAIYEKLGEIYSVHSPNLSRAEVAFKEVLKRAPGDIDVLRKLVDVYRRQSDIASAVETQQQIVDAATEPDARLAALIELASIHETVGKDPRKSERVLETARKEFPTSVVALRTMAEFYQRHRQMPAMQILLDRAAADARRAFAQGRFVPALFEVLHAAFELRGKRDAASVVAATLAAVEGQPSRLSGAAAEAIDPQLDDLLTTDLMSPALRAVLARTGDTLDAVANVDLRVLAAKPLPSGTSIGRTIGAVATVIGLGALQILVSPHLGRVALPLSTNPPTLLVGEGLARETNEPARVFVVVRALKMLQARASATLRGSADEVATAVAALFVALNPSFVPSRLDMKQVTELSRRIAPALPKNLDPTVGVLALEAAGTLGTSWAKLGPAAHGWANRVALLAVGDPNAALDALAWGHDEDSAPSDPEERAAWIARHEDARELMTFSVTDAYAEARARLALR